MCYSLFAALFSKTFLSHPPPPSLSNILGPRLATFNAGDAVNEVISEACEMAPDEKL